MKFFIIGAFILGSAAMCAQSATDVPQQNSTSPEATVAKESRPANAPASLVYKVGGSVKPPKLIYQEKTQYSKEARKKKISGEVLVQCNIDENGLPQDVKVVKSVGYGLDEQALMAVKLYRFAPATKDGQPVKVQLNVSVNFQIFDKH